MLDKGDISKNIYVILYVDDLILVTKHINTLNNFKRYLNSKFSMSDLNDVKLFLGIRINRKSDCITLDQSAYVKTILNNFGMSDCKVVK